MEQIYYKSTRGNEKLVKSAEAIARGLSEDGGLFVPTSIPKLNVTLEELREMDYKKIAFTIMKEFLTDYDEKEQQTSGDDKETRIKLELLFPELFGGFLGRNNAYKAAGRVFESFQNELLNMNLTTTILVEVVKELFPELDRVL